MFSVLIRNIFHLQSFLVSSGIELLGRRFVVLCVGKFGVSEVIAAFVLLLHAVGEEEEEENCTQESDHSTSYHRCRECEGKVMCPTFAQNKFIHNQKRITKCNFTSLKARENLSLSTSQSIIPLNKICKQLRIAETHPYLPGLLSSPTSSPMSLLRVCPCCETCCLDRQWAQSHSRSHSG